MNNNVNTDQIQKGNNVNQETLDFIKKLFREMYFEIQEIKKISEKLVEEYNEKDDKKFVLGVPEVMKLLGIGRANAEKIMWGNNFPTIQIGRRKLVHKDVLEKWIKTGGKVSL